MRRIKAERGKAYAGAGKHPVIKRIAYKKAECEKRRGNKQIPRASSAAYGCGHALLFYLLFCSACFNIYCLTALSSGISVQEASISPDINATLSPS